MDARKGKNVSLINREDLLRKQAITYDYNGFKLGIVRVSDIVEAPEVKNPEVIRCIDCKHFDTVCSYCLRIRDWMTPDDYCSRGEPL